MVHNLVIVGSGPAGYTAAIYAARANLKPVMYTGLLQGGQLMNTTDVENFPGYPSGILGPEMMEDFKQQAERFGTDIRFGMATKVDFSVSPKKVWIDDTKLIEADAVILGEADGEDDELDGEDLGEVEVLVLVEQHGADATFSAGDAFDHREHHPADGRILTEHFDGGEGGRRIEYALHFDRGGQAATDRCPELGERGDVLNPQFDLAGRSINFALSGNKINMTSPATCLMPVSLSGSADISSSHRQLSNEFESNTVATSRKQLACSGRIDVHRPHGRDQLQSQVPFRLFLSHAFVAAILHQRSPKRSSVSYEPCSMDASR